MLLSSCLDFLYEKIQKLTAPKIWVTLVSIFIIVTFTNGIWVYPPTLYQRLAKNPFVTRADIDPDNYWQETVLLPVIAFYTRLNSSSSFYRLCLGILVLGYGLFAQLAFRRDGPAAALIYTALLITNPITTVMLSWLGTPDTLTFALTVPFLFVNSGLLIFLLSVLGTMNHIVFIIVAGEILILRWIARERTTLFHLLASIIGGIVGYALIQIFFAYNHIQATTRLDFVFSKDLATWVEMNVTNLPITIFSLFNIQWLVLIICLIMFFKMDRRYYACVLAILLFNSGVTFFTEDTTRIFSLLSWGVLMQCVFHSYKLARSTHEHDLEAPYPKQFLQALMTIGLVSLIAPHYYAWNGKIYPTPFYTFLSRFLNNGE